MPLRERKGKSEMLMMILYLLGVIGLESLLEMGMEYLERKHRKQGNGIVNVRVYTLNGKKVGS